jgi:hypothetical protein
LNLFSVPKSPRGTTERSPARQRWESRFKLARSRARAKQASPVVALHPFPEFEFYVSRGGPTHVSPRWGSASSYWPVSHRLPLAWLRAGALGYALPSLRDSRNTNALSPLFARRGNSHGRCFLSGPARVESVLPLWNFPGCGNFTPCVTGLIIQGDTRATLRTVRRYRARRNTPARGVCALCLFGARGPA